MTDAHPSTLQQFIFVFIAIIAVLANSGCSSTSAAKADSPTGGISLEMSITGHGNLAVLYRIEQDGSIHFGGGLDAQQNKTSWTSHLTEQDIMQLIALLNKHGWFNELPYSLNMEADRKYSVKLQWPGGRKSFKVQGRSLYVAPIEDLLVKIANRRHDVFLESLPNATDLPD